MRQRELWETIVDLLESLATPEDTRSGLRIASVTCDLPVEVRAQPTEAGFKLLVDLPRRRWTEGFHIQPGRIKIDLRPEDSA